MDLVGTDVSPYRLEHEQMSELHHFGLIKLGPYPFAEPKLNMLLFFRTSMLPSDVFLPVAVLFRPGFPLASEVAFSPLCKKPRILPLSPLSIDTFLMGELPALASLEEASERWPTVVGSL